MVRDTPVCSPEIRYNLLWQAALDFQGGHLFFLWDLLAPCARP